MLFDSLLRNNSTIKSRNRNIILANTFPFTVSEKFNNKVKRQKYEGSNLQCSGGQFQNREYQDNNLILAKLPNPVC